MAEAESQAQSAEGEADEELIPRRGSYSAVWNYFGFQSSDLQQKDILCKTCRRIVPAPQGNTTNLFNHLKFHHLEKYNQCMRSKAPLPRATGPMQTTISATLHSATPYLRTSQRHAEITNEIAIYLAKAMAPISTVENKAFKKMIHTLDKRYEIPSRNYFSKVALPSLYNQLREKIKKEVSALPYYATTTDLWSSRTMEPYLSLTIHYINDDFEIKNHCLQTSFFPEDHTGEVIAQGLAEALASWDLQEEKLVCITTDNGANVVKAASLNQWTRLQCFGHRLHLAIGE